MAVQTAVRLRTSNVLTHTLSPYLGWVDVNRFGCRRNGLTLLGDQRHNASTGMKPGHYRPAEASVRLPIHPHPWRTAPASLHTAPETVPGSARVPLWSPVTVTFPLLEPTGYNPHEACFPVNAYEKNAKTCQQPDPNSISKMSCGSISCCVCNSVVVIS